tara:strand:+ start:150 stop:476 length:327 start_codon:yes stop_codon:yes gene_type:complete
MYNLINKPVTANSNFYRNNPEPSTSWISHRLFNLGNEKSIKILEFIQLLENELGIESLRKYDYLQPGVIQDIYSIYKSLKDWIGEIDYTSIKKGVKHFVNWYKDYYEC